LPSAHPGNRLMPVAQYDACIVGGGPAGVVAAIQLARTGHRVCLIERQVFPRGHVGESFSAGTLRILDSIGCRQLIWEAGSRICKLAYVRWSSPDPERISDRQRAATVLVDRGCFDVLMIQAAAQAGVAILQPASVQHLNRVQNGWRVHCRSDNATLLIDARFLIDASGRRHWLSPKRQWARCGPQTVALYADFTPPDEYQQTVIEAMRQGWCWGAPFPGRFRSMVFIDRTDFPRAASMGLEVFLRERLRECELLERISRATLQNAVFSCDASIYRARECIGQHWIKIGEANFTLDPLSSSGVEKAMQSALHGASVVHTLLRRPDSEELCTRFYQARVEEVVNTHSRWAGESYDSVQRYAQEPFWLARASRAVSDRATARVPQPVLAGRPLLPSTPVRISDQVRFHQEPCIVQGEIRAQTAISHPGLERPVAFLGGIPIGDLLQPAAETRSLADWTALWAKRVSGDCARQIADWMVSHQVLMC